MFVVISGRQGIDKSRVVDRLVENGKVVRVVTDTSRIPKKKEDGSYEIHAKDYYFVPMENFRNPIFLDTYLEKTQRVDYRGQKVYFGTSHLSVRQARQQGDVLLLGLDPQGLIAMKETFGAFVLTVALNMSEEDVRERVGRRVDLTEECRKTIIQQGQEDLRTLYRNGHLIDLWVDHFDATIDRTIATVRSAINAHFTKQPMAAQK